MLAEPELKAVAAGVQSPADGAGDARDLHDELEAVMAALTDEEKAGVRAGMEKAGWRATTVAEFLGLAGEDMAIIEARRAARP